MAPKCCVPNCSSNYSSKLSQEGYVPVFRFPISPDLKEQWIKNIPRADWQPSKSSVCIKHFRENDISRTEKYKDASGEWKEFPRKKLELVIGAVPTVFPCLPNYLTLSTPTQRTNPELRRQNVATRYEAQVQEWLDSDKIVDFQYFCDQIHSGEKVYEQWGVHFTADKVIFCIYNFDKVPCIPVSVTVSSDMTCSVFVNNFILTKQQLKGLLPFNLKLTLWSQLENILSRYRNFEVTEVPSDTHIQHYVESIKSQLSSLSNEDNISAETEKRLKFISEQFQLIFGKQRKYSADTVLWSFMIYLQSPSCYSVIRETGSIIIPHSKYLQQLASAFLVSPNCPFENERFLKLAAKHLSDRERYVVLQIDEIYVHPRIDFKGGQITGYAENNILSSARTLQTFLVSSAFGSFKEVISVHPMKNSNGSDLYELTAKVVDFVHSCDLKIIVIVSDNNRINRCLFNLFDPRGTHCVNFVPSHVTFLTFDSVHVFKNIRNNWLNMKDAYKTFYFPSFHGDETVLEARFYDFRELYHVQKNCLLRTAHRLNYKSIFPTNLERQKVSLVCSIFNESTYSALKQEWDKQSGVVQCEGTAEFVHIISKWWSVVNIKSAFKGYNTRNSLEIPYSSMDDERLIFLENFLLWLKRWKDVGRGGLTNETFSALFQCTSVLLSFIKHSISVLKVEYVLPGKIQTDVLEQKFSAYRQLCGGNYNVSVSAVLECEKKLRIKSLLGLRSAKYGILRLSKLSDASVESPDVTIQVNDFSDIFLESDYLEQDIDMSSLIYVAGYAAFSVSARVNCRMCVSHFKSENVHDVNDTYMKQINRGGLTVPSDLCMETGKHVFCVMNTLISEAYESKFLLHGHQKELLLSLSKISLTENEEINLFVSDICVCGNQNEKVYDNILSVFCNTLLNNYVKQKNDCKEGKSVQQKRKLQTLTQ